MLTVAETLRKLLVESRSEVDWCNECIEKHQEKLGQLQARKAKHEDRSAELVKLLRMMGEQVEPSKDECSKVAWNERQEGAEKALLSPGNEIPF